MTYVCLCVCVHVMCGYVTYIYACYDPTAVLHATVPLQCFSLQLFCSNCNIIITHTGMQPLLYSEREAEGRGVGWRRVGHNIR